MLILLNKPFNVLCQFTSPDGRSCLKNYVDIPDIYPAGRLDYDSEGALLLTDDGRLQHKITDPSRGFHKTYWAQVEGLIDEPALNSLRRGVRLNDGLTKPAIVRTLAEPDHIWPRMPPIRLRTQIPTSWLELKLTEGRNRQVRRMTAAVGLPTLRLIRVAIGGTSILNLRPGEWRQITASECLNSR